MAKRFRAATVFFNTRKIAELTNSNFGHESNDEAQFGIDGYLGHSDGNDMTTCTFDTAVPVSGHEITFKKVLVGKEYVQLSVIVDGGAEMVEGRLTGRSYTSDSKTGAVKGNFKFEGGAPTLV